MTSYRNVEICGSDFGIYKVRLNWIRAYLGFGRNSADEQVDPSNTITKLVAI